MKSKFFTGRFQSHREVEDWLNAFSGHLVIHHYYRYGDYYELLVEEYFINEK
jgi:hypothetical protein